MATATAMPVRLAMAKGQKDLALVGVAGSVVVLGTSLGWNPIGMLIAVLAAPVVAVVVSGYVAGRGAIAGCMALGFGSGLIRQVPGTIPWADLALLGSVAVIVVMAASWADAFAAAARASVDAAELKRAGSKGMWLTVVVHDQDGDNLTGRFVRPPCRPLKGPERRSLARLASERRRQAGRRERLCVVE